MILIIQDIFGGVHWIAIRLKEKIRSAISDGKYIPRRLRGNRNIRHTDARYLSVQPFG